MTSTPFIVVFRPHQFPAWAEIFDSEDKFRNAWINGQFARRCHATAGLSFLRTMSLPSAF